MGAVRYLLLGNAEVWDGEVAVPLGGARLRALVTALALRPGRAVGQHELIAEVWAEDPPADAAGALQALVARLRRALGREAVTSDPGGGYRLVVEPEAVDLFAFEALVREGEAALGRGAAAEARTVLTRALALWRGPALADLPDRTAAAARPEALRLAAVRLRIEADLALGRADDALPELGEAVAGHPLDEAFRVQLIRALRAAGRTADALVAYEDARMVLAETLGADPGPELRSLHAELLPPEPLLPPPAPAAGRRPGNLRARLTSFVGREAELDAIRADLAAARLVTLTGPGAPERAALRALSVFAGGCSLPAAEAVCGPDALDTVGQLVDKSLVVAEHGRPGGTRYRLLETIHEYAAERLAAHPGEAAAAGARHTAYYRDLAAAADPQLRGADQMHWLEVLETEVDNVRAALHRAIAAGAAEDAVLTALSLGWFWSLRNYRDEASAVLDRVLALTGGPPADEADPMYWPWMDLRLLDFFVKSDLASQEQWFTAEGRATAELLIGAYSKGGPAAARFPGLLWPFTGYVYGGIGDIRRHADTVVANCREYGGDWELAAALMFRTHVTVDSPGSLERADADRVELRQLGSRLGDRWIRAQLHGASAEIESLRCHYDRARADFEAALALTRELGANSEGAFLIGRLAELAYRAGDDEAARDLCARAEEEAERFSVSDVRPYLRYLNALLLLERGEVAAARAMCAPAERHLADGTQPPTFRVLLSALAARISAAEGDPGAALAGLAAAAGTAQEVGCTDPVLAAQLDSAAGILLALGDTAAAVRLSAAADEVRGVLPRTVREAAADDALRRRAAELLPGPDLSAARTAVRGLDRPGAVALLAGLAATRSPAGESRGQSTGRSAQAGS
jgi:DNA-binding SARP family transcriptional activator